MKTGVDHMGWITPASAHIKSNNKDVTVTVIGKKLPSASVKFYNKAELHVLKSEDGLMQVAIIASRLYFKFKQAEQGERGFKLGKDNSNCVCKRLQTSHKGLVEFCEKHRGSYNLKYDTMRKLYYIDTVTEE